MVLLLLLHRFLGELFFLSSQEAYLQFSRNPRPYLEYGVHPKMPVRIAIMGFQNTGAKTLSRIIADRHGAAWISLSEILGQKIAKKRARFLADVKQKTETKILDTLMLQQKREINEIKTSRFQCH